MRACTRRPAPSAGPVTIRALYHARRGRIGASRPEGRALVLDHLILNVNDVEASARFYAEVLGFTDEGPHPPFRMLRVSPELVLLLGPWATEGGEHLAFAMGRAEFEAVFRRLRAQGLAYGDDPHAPDNGRGPHEERVDGGARGRGTSLYFHDPNRHVIEIRHYE